MSFMKQITLGGSAFGLVAVLLAGPSQAQTLYAMDDGVPNSGLSYGLPTDYCWFQFFDTVGPVDSIANLQVMFQPSGIRPGTPITLCVWEDPNNDGDPADAQLLASTTSTVPAVSTFAYTVYPLPAPATVHGTFFVGAFLTTDGNAGAISLLDYDTTYSHRAYFATDAPGFFDPALLSSSFYNHIEVLGAGIHGVFLLRAEGSVAPTTTYCVAKVNSRGCTPQINWLGTPSSTATAGFFVLGTNEINRKPGILLFTTGGRAAVPFFGGTLCLAPTVLRTAPQNSGGSAVGIDCTGVYSFDFNAFNSGLGGPHFPAGTTVDAQYYSRDNGFPAPNNVGLTGGLEFTLGA